MKKLVSGLAVGLGLMLASCTQDVPSTVTTAIAPAPNSAVLPYQADIELLASRIKEEHPRPFRMISEPEFDAIVAEAKASIRPEFAQRDTLWAFSRILTSLGCGHTRQFYFVQEDQRIDPSARFPVDVRYVDGKLYVFDPLANARTVSTGDIITSINGRKVDDIIAEIYQHIPADMNNPFLKRQHFNVSATSYLTYALDFPETYSVSIAGQGTPIALEPLTEFSHAPIVSPKSPCQDKLCYRVDDKTNTGIYTIRTFDFYGDRGAEFAEFTNNVFSDLSDNQRRNLVLDVRDNDGGSGLAAAYISRRLADAPFSIFSDESDPRGGPSLFETQIPVETGFDGDVYILMNGNTVSAAPHFFAVARANNMATLVGEPAGGNHSTNDGKIQFTSETSKIDYWIARMRFDVEAGDADIDQPIRPDIAIPYTVSETLSREDEMMQSLLEIIEERQ